MKITVIGAGVTGLASGKILKDMGHDCVIYERSDSVAVWLELVWLMVSLISRWSLFNSKFPDVLEFIFKTCPLEEWNVIERVAKIDLNGNLIGYPIEFDLPQLSALDQELPVRVLKELFDTDQNGAAPQSLEGGLFRNLEKLCRIYTFPV